MTSTDERWALAGDVHTMDSAQPRARVVVVEGERIIEVGGEGLLREVRAAGVPTVDVGDRVALPGFVDPHAHSELASRALTEMVDVRAPKHRTVDDVLQTLRENTWRGDESGWIIGQAGVFFDRRLEEKRLPTRAELDAVSTKVSIVVRAGGHRSVLNTKAFEVSNIVRYAGQEGMMGGAVIERDSSGEPTGVVCEVDQALPLPEPDEATLRHEIKDGMRELFTKFGVTSVGEISDTERGLRQMDLLIQSGELPVRYSVYLWVPGTMGLDEALEWRERLDFQSPEHRMTVRGVKVFADGGYTSRNAATRVPFLDPQSAEQAYGQLNFDRHRIADVVTRTRDAGLQLAVHACGERAQDEVCAGVVSTGPVDVKLRTRLEHAGNLVMDEVTFEGWRDAAIVPAPQPGFIHSFGDMLPAYLGEPARKGRFPFRTILDRGWKISGSSDVYMGADPRITNPLFGAWCSLKRETFSGEIVEPEQRITLDEALEMHTINAASAIGVGDERGTLTAGKLADVVVLAEDPYSADVDRLSEIPVDTVFVGGARVYDR